MEPVKICLVGCGRISNSHMAGMAEIPGELRVVAAVEPNAESRAAFGERYGVRTLYASLDEALAAGGFDAVDLCLPNFAHEENAIRALDAGYHVFVEKPMANTVAACERMNAAAARSGKNLMVGQSRRFYDAVRLSKSMLDEGRIGSLVTITAELMGFLDGPPTEWWRSRDQAGGLMIPLWGNHIFDYILWMFGQSPQRIYCEACSVNPAWEGEDETTILLGFDHGRYATVKMSWNTRLAPDRSWDGKGKILSSSDILYRRYIQGASGTLMLDDETALTHNGAPILSGEQKPGNFAVTLREFARSVREGRAPEASGREVLDVIRVQEAALESARTHCPVYL